MTTGRRSVAPQIVATVMVLHRLEGLSDREAVERFEFDGRRKYACGVAKVSAKNTAHLVCRAIRTLRVT